MIQKLKRKFVVLNLSMITVILIIMLAAIISMTQHSLRQNEIDTLLRLARTPQQANAKKNHPPDDLTYAYLYLRTDVQGNIIQKSAVQFPISEENEQRALLDEANAAGQPLSTYEQLEKKPKEILETGVLSAYQVRFLQVKTPHIGNTYVFLDISGSQIMLRTLTRNCLLIGLFAFALFFAISVWFARWAARPVETAWNDQKQFIADASHELKTPLTVILTNTQLLRTPDFTEAEKRRFTDNILSTAEQMRTLITGLLDLSRADRGTMQSDTSACCLSDLLTQQLCLYEPIYFEHGFSLQQEISPAVFIRGNSAQLRQIIDVLLDNADKYADSGSEISVSLHTQRHHALLAVTTAGKSLSVSEQKAIFQRFYRADKARSSCGSYGLGLSIAETLVRAHSGAIWAECGTHSNTFFVRFPAHTEKNKLNTAHCQNPVQKK